MGRGHEGRRSARRRVEAVAAALAVAMALPVVAGADALPDGRAYEQVSPVNKYSFAAGAPGGAPKYSVATADGNGLLYGVLGPMGTVHRGIQGYAVGRRGVDGWTSESALPAGSADRIYLLSSSPWSVVPSSDLTKIVFLASGSFVPDNPETLSTSAALYEGHADGSIDWLTRPRIANPTPAPGDIPGTNLFQPVGGSPDLDTVYFWAKPTLLPEDAARASGSGWGLYEYTNGVLEPAGTLPDGSEDPGGAAPAASSGTSRDFFNLTTPEMPSNQVSRDGSTLWFVSPDPGLYPVLGPVTQLYVRRGGHSTLVSHTAGGTPAPSGVTAVRALNSWEDGFAHQLAYGSADGKSAIFISSDALAQGAPGDSSQKAYRYDVATDTVTYLAGVGAGTIVAASDDGQRFLFEDGTHIAVWDHGTVKTIATVQIGQLRPARATASGSTFLFSTRAAIPGFNSGGFVQVYRYDVAEDKTTCLSCPPDGTAPSGDANLSNQDTQTNPGGSRSQGELIPSRGMSADAGRVFFDTPDPLVPRDTNGERDVYEWTPGGVALISTGRSQDPSFFMDNSSSGDDVFFSTSENLDPGDTDNTYDVYDARVGGGFKAVAQPAPCTGDACQGGVSGSPSLPVPGTTRFSGAGDQEPPKGEPVPSAKLKLGSRTVASGVLEVSVTIARPGRVSVSGGGLRSATKSYAKAGTFKVKVSLSAAAKRSLKSKHRLKLSVRVGFTPNSGPASSVKFVLNAKA
jgi:hypothetical protein